MTAAIVLSFMRALGEFGATLMIAGNIPGKTQTVPIAIFFAVESGEFGQAFLLSAIIMSISVGVVFLMSLLSRE